MERETSHRRSFETDAAGSRLSRAISSQTPPPPDGTLALPGNAHPSHTRLDGIGTSPLPDRGRGEVLGVRGVMLDPIAAMVLARRRKGLTNDALARAAGISSRSIEAWTAHKASPSLASLSAVFRVLGLRLVVLSGERLDDGG